MSEIAISLARQDALAALSYVDNPFLAWSNLGASATLGGTTTLAGGQASKAFNGKTYNYWLPDVAATTARLSVQFASARTISFVGIAAHNLGTLGASVRVQRSTDGVSWTDAGAGLLAPTDDGPLGWRMVTSGQDYAYWSLYITGLTASDPVAIGVAFFGDDMVIPQRFYSSFAPVITPTEVALQSNVSQGGNLVGTHVVQRGSRLSTEIAHLQASFIRGTDWKAFQTAFNEGAPAFFGWRPDTYPEDLHYLWRDGPVLQPQNMGIRSLMSVGLQARVYEG